jgi:WD40 repeat protein
MNNSYIFVIGYAPPLSIVQMCEEVSHKALLKSDHFVSKAKFLSETEIVTGDREGYIKLNGTYEDRVKILHKHSGPVRCVAVNTMKGLVASGAFDEIIISNINTKEVKKFQMMDEDYFTSIDISPDGTRLASISGNGAMRIWSLTYVKNQEIEHEPLYYTSPVKNSNYERVLFTLDGKQVLVSRMTYEVLVFDAESTDCDDHEYEIEYEYPVHGMELTCKNMLITSHFGINMPFFNIYDMDTERHLGKIDAPGFPTITSWTVTPDGKYIVIKTHTEPFVMIQITAPHTRIVKMNFPSGVLDCSLMLSS